MVLKELLYDDDPNGPDTKDPNVPPEKPPKGNGGGNG